MAESENSSHRFYLLPVSKLPNTGTSLIFRHLCFQSLAGLSVLPDQQRSRPPRGDEQAAGDPVQLALEMGYGNRSAAPAEPECRGQICPADQLRRFRVLPPHPV